VGSKKTPCWPENLPFIHATGMMQLMLRCFLLVLLLFMLGCAPAPKPQVHLEPPAVDLPASVKELTPDEVERFLAEHVDAPILDVRTQEEWKEHGHILNAELYDWFNQAAKDAVSKLDKTKPCLVYCAIGGRAGLMAMDMSKMGFQSVNILKGGFNAWTGQGKAIAK